MRCGPWPRLQHLGESVHRRRRSALASLRRSIDRKKRQCDPNLPHFLATSPTFPQIPTSPSEFANTWDVFGPLIEERLWPNEKYSWLSGILQHTLIRVAPPSQLSYWVGCNPNPNAAVAAPDTIMRALTGEAEFHAMWQRPKRPEAAKLCRSTGDPVDSLSAQRGVGPRLANHVDLHKHWWARTVSNRRPLVCKGESGGWLGGSPAVELVKHITVIHRRCL